MTPAQIDQLVAAELAGISDPARRTALQAALVAPTSHERSSQYAAGTFRCWVVARDKVGRHVLVHCSDGPFADPWGCVEEGEADLGVDAQWFTKLDDAFIAGMWDGPLPPGYEVE